MHRTNQKEKRFYNKLSVDGGGPMSAKFNTCKLHVPVHVFVQTENESPAENSALQELILKIFRDKSGTDHYCSLFCFYLSKPKVDRFPYYRTLITICCFIFIVKHLSAFTINCKNSVVFN